MSARSGQTTFVLRTTMAALVASVLIASPFAAGPQDPDVCAADAPVADLSFTLRDMDGNEVALSQFRGKVLLLDFWATWCAPCRVEMPGFVDLYARYGPRGLAIIGISVDDPVSKMRPFAEQLKIDYPLLVGRGRDDVQDAYGPLITFPTSFLIDRDGRICHRHTGFTPKEQFEREIKALL